MRTGCLRFGLAVGAALTLGAEPVEEAPPAQAEPPSSSATPAWVTAQATDGGWWPNEAAGEGTDPSGRVAATSLAVLALQSTDASRHAERYRTARARGVAWIRGRPTSPTGRIGEGAYEHALATFVLAEELRHVDASDRTAHAAALAHALGELERMGRPEGRGLADAWSAVALVTAHRAGALGAGSRERLSSWSRAALAAEPDAAGAGSAEERACAAAAAVTLLWLERGGVQQGDREDLVRWLQAPAGPGEDRELDALLLGTWAAFLAGGRDAWKPWERHARRRLDEQPPGPTAQRPAARGGAVGADALRGATTAVFFRVGALAILE